VPKDRLSSGPGLPVLLITGAKDSGKTSLAIELIRCLRTSGTSVFALKHASSVAAVEQPGTDTWRFALAGAEVTGLTWPGGSYVSWHGPGTPEGGYPPALASHRLDRPARLEELAEVAFGLAPDGPRRLVLAEGFSSTPYPRIHVLSRPGHPERTAGGPLLDTWSPEGGDVEAIARKVDRSRPVLTRWAEEAANSKPGSRHTVAAVIAGGKGRRLGGRDKWRLEIGGTRQSERCLGKLAEVFGEILVVGRPELPNPGGASLRASGAAGVGPGVSVSYLADLAPDAGPLGGLLTALRAAPGRHTGAFAGDLPFMNGNLIQHLLFTAERHSGTYDVLLPVWECAGGRFAEPLHALYAPTCLSRLESLFATSGTLAGLRLTAAFDGLRVREVPDAELRLFGDPRVFFHNLNTPADVARAEELATLV
jgi:molybdopterin-guanine dinucleotide biosynthesis protein A